MNNSGVVFKDRHEMHINEHLEQGGALEEVVFWCRTCSPDGIEQQVFDVRDPSPFYAWARALRHCAVHSYDVDLYDMSVEPPGSGLADHQVWVGMNGPGARHWEVRGTGAIF